VIASNVLRELERVARECGVDSADALGCVYSECLTISASTDFELISTAHEVVVDRIEWKQYANAAIWFGMQDQQVTIRLSTDIDSHAVTQLNVILAQPELHGRIVLLR